LWWQIERIIREKKENKNPFSFLLFENVDRLLLSPSTQKGRDFALILASLNNLGYCVEWRVINAADYGMPQKRKRIFIFAYLNSPSLENINHFIFKECITSKAFPIHETSLNTFSISNDLVDITHNFNKENKKLFLEGGIAINHHIFTHKVSPNYQGKKMIIKDIIEPFENIDKSLYVSNEALKKWENTKTSHSIDRISKQGFSYCYKQGNMDFPDSLEKPARTIITSEGTKTALRTSHIIKTNNQFRRLSALELERLMMFPDNHTKMDTISYSKRAFLLGNALMIGVVEKYAFELKKL